MSNDKLNVTYKTPSGPHTCTADMAPVGAIVDITGATISDFDATRNSATLAMVLTTEAGSCSATIRDEILEASGSLIANGRTINARAVVDAVMSPTGEDGVTVPCLRIKEAFAVTQEPHEVGWEDGGQEHAEVMAWSADDGRPILYTDPHGKKFLFTPTPYEA
jgi:hypothetical protein